MREGISRKRWIDIESAPVTYERSRRSRFFIMVVYF